MADPVDKDTITEVELNGAGTFDHLMKAVKEHLQEEYKENRIRNTDYANVYTSAISTTMQQAIQFELGRQTAAAQAALLEVEKAKVDAEILGVLATNKLIDQQIEKIKVEILLLKQSELKMNAEIINLGFQNDLIVQQIAKSKEDVKIAIAELANITKVGLKLDAETGLIVQQDLKLVEETDIAKEELTIAKGKALDQGYLSRAVALYHVNTTKEQYERAIQETNLLTNKVATELTQNSVLSKQITKFSTEIALLTQKTQTEISQTQDEIIIDGVSTKVAGAMGRKNSLYFRQTEGFKRDAEQKVAKIYTDMWNVSKSADPSGTFQVEVLGEAERYQPADSSDPDWDADAAEEADPDNNDPIAQKNAQPWITVPADKTRGGYTLIQDVLKTARDNVINPPTET